MTVNNTPWKCFTCGIALSDEGAIWYYGRRRCLDCVLALRDDTEVTVRVGLLRRIPAVEDE